MSTSCAVAGDTGFLLGFRRGWRRGTGASRPHRSRGLADPGVAGWTRAELGRWRAAHPAASSPVRTDRHRRAALQPALLGELSHSAVAVRRLADGRAWITTVGVEPESPRTAWQAIACERASLATAPDGFMLRSPISHHAWADIVRAALAAIDAGAFAKVVLAREVVVEANAPISRADVLRRLRALYPSCITYSVDGFVGASPELLISRNGDVVRSHPLAGTGPRSGDRDCGQAAARRAPPLDQGARGTRSCRQRRHGRLVTSVQHS